MEIFSKEVRAINQIFYLFVNSLVRKSSDRYWEKSTDYYRDGIQLKRHLINSYDASVKNSFLKKDSLKRKHKIIIIKFFSETNLQSGYTVK